MIADILGVVQWLWENAWLVVAGAVALVTAQFWLPAVVRFFTETKVGAALGAAAVAFGGGWLLLKKDRAEQYQRGRADENAKWREKLTPKAKAAPKREWWKGKR
jgi:hypothetical protein